MRSVHPARANTDDRAVEFLAWLETKRAEFMRSHYDPSERAEFLIGQVDQLADRRWVDVDAAQAERWRLLSVAADERRMAQILAAAQSSAA